MPEIYHITKIDNLPSIIESGCLLSDRRVLATKPDHAVIGYSHIKRRRLEEIPVVFHPGTTVGDFVPFYFCPRSVMLYVIWKRPDELGYKGGQDEVVHLVSSVEDAVATGQPVAFSASNAGARYTTFYQDIRMMDRVLKWDAIKASDWREPAVKDKKQAEFLVRDEFPWTGIAAIGVFSKDVRARVEGVLEDSSHKPPIAVRRAWYYP